MQAFAKACMRVFVRWHACMQTLCLSQVCWQESIGWALFVDE